MFASFRVTKLVGFIGVVGMLGMAGSAYAADNVAGTAHNLSTSPEGICVYCHTPHGGSQDVAPLWNRNSPVPASFTPYTNSKGVENVAPGGVSLACLSCHDGSLTFDDVLHNPATGAGEITTNNVAMLGTAAGFIGTDLTNQHPISMALPISSGFELAADVALAGVKLFTGKVECASCHNPHEDTNEKFLRVNNADSTLCVACHTN